MSPDPKDIVYIALALTLKCYLWSNDKELKEIQENICILSTTEIIKRTKFLN
ncbi:MAG: hypothetical protein GF383_11480 [Candidatus Lokiarchaeota archaeon]|nr:hypothetical protein [Candidatus Lokiarchaeota archaeon]MBD3341345.1 hypothetical protein [Candidatus Lokiarchaeota archaeon]